jgi:ABC-2 type transport system ATP-binding protein
MISVEKLVKNYGSFRALQDVSFEVQKGEVFGLLGPNGAGKTTTVEILEGIRDRTSGQVSVLGYDPARQNSELKDLIGVSLQATNLPPKIRVKEALALFSCFYSQRVSPSLLLRQLQLEDKQHSFFETLSGGQKQRLTLALALVNNPQILFLDEPTAGLDPQARQMIHGLIEQLRDESRSVLLTTHYIEEAEKLCDRVAIMEGGKIIAIGTPQELRRKTLGQTLLRISCTGPMSAKLPALSEKDFMTLSADRRLISVQSDQPTKSLVQLVRWIDNQKIDISHIDMKSPTLEDVFIELTGRSLRE